MAVSPSWHAVTKTTHRSSLNKTRDPPPPLPSIRFPKLPKPKVIEINSIQPKKKNKSSTAIDVLRLMDSLQLPIKADMYASLVKECTHSKDALQAAQVHDHIQASALRPSLLLTNRLLLMYTACTRLETARKLFDKMPVRDSISWATLIIGHAEHDQHSEALKLFVEMLKNGGVQPTSLILIAVLKACIHERDLEFGKQIHGRALKTGDCNHMLLGSSFIDLYGKLGFLESAQMLFDQMSRLDTVVWTAMIVGYCRQSRFEEAVKVFKEMERAGKKKNNYTFSIILRACGKMSNNNGEVGRQVHAKAIKVGVEEDLFVQSSLVNMYGKCGLLKDARKAFEMIDPRNTVCWNAMLSGYAQNGCCDEAIKFLYEMKAAGVELQESMLNQVRLACGE
ncbi:tetratricopeptide repeat (TPR)-like superfamily protein [Tasmannia lanceolata]|uniref:tetratricopeptide repeat (TPR)-like superfamily protein n=1 Tax=Tasmannia lanceolata TaxID=3420 RepID=UPI004063C939